MSSRTEKPPPAPTAKAATLATDGTTATVAQVVKVAVPKVLSVVQEDAMRTLWETVTLDQMELVFTPAVHTPVTYWVRLGCPVGFEGLINVLSEERNATVHRKKGWHAGMCVMIHMRVLKGGAAMSANETLMWNNYYQVVPGLAALVFDDKGPREKVTVAKLENAVVEILTSELDVATRKWLSKTWPAK